MQRKHVYTHYAKQEHPVPAKYKYCPICTTELILKESGQLLRPTCPACGFIHFINPSPAVSVWVIEEDKVLLGKRTGEPGKGEWAPPSGYIEFENDFLTTGILEVKEETGLKVEIVSILNVISAFVSPRFHFLTVHLLARVVGGELAARDDLEVIDWFPLSGSLPQMAFQEDVNMLEWYSTTRSEGIPVATRLTPKGGKS